MRNTLTSRFRERRKNMKLKIKTRNYYEQEAIRRNVVLLV
jgi:hypothetical protein